MLDRVQDYQLLQYYTGSGVRSESLGRCQAQRGAAEAEVSEYGSAGRTASCSTASSPCECFSLLDSSHHPISTLLRLKDMIQKAPAALTKKPAVRLKTEEEFRIRHLSDLYIHPSVCLPISVYLSYRQKEWSACFSAIQKYYCLQLCLTRITVTKESLVFNDRHACQSINPHHHLLLSRWVKWLSRRLECSEALVQGRSHFKPISPHPHTLEKQCS